MAKTKQEAPRFADPIKELLDAIDDRGIVVTEYVKIGSPNFDGRYVYPPMVRTEKRLRRALLAVLPKPAAKRKRAKGRR